MSHFTEPTATRLSRRRKQTLDHRGKPFSRLAAIGCLILWALATGAHWDALQVIAWARMANEGATERSLGKAFAQAIATEERCSLCIVVQEAKQQAEEQEPLGSMGDKLLLVWIRPSACVVPAPSAKPLNIRLESVGLRLEEAPAVPPPRTA